MLRNALFVALASFALSTAALAQKGGHHGSGSHSASRSSTRAKPSGTHSRSSANSINTYVGPPEDLRHHALITFDYLGPNQGFVLSIFHTCKHDELWVQGAVVGVCETPENVTNRTFPRAPEALLRMLIEPQ